MHCTLLESQTLIQFVPLYMAMTGVDEAGSSDEAGPHKMAD